MAPGADAAAPRGPAPSGAPPEGDFRQTLAQARRLRDYLLRSDAKANPALVAAIAPFGGPGEPDPEDRRGLYVAFQAAYEEAQGFTDPHTLSEVLAGRTPYRLATWREKAGDVVLLLLGISLTAIALSYSYWAGRATYTLDQIDNFFEFDHRASIMRLMEMETFFEDSVDDPPYQTVEPLLVYNEVLDDLRGHYNLESELPSKLNDLLVFHTPIDIIWTENIDAYCRRVVMEEVESLPRRYFCGRFEVETYAQADPAPPKETQGQAAASIGDAAGTALASSDPAAMPLSAEEPPGATRAAAGSQGTAPPVPVLRSVNRTYLEDWHAAMLFAGRDPNLNGDTYTTRFSLRQQADELASRLANVQNWWLPTVYGALGAVVYCMWRALNPRVAPLGMLDGGMRIAFAGLAGLTLSMLLLPSNLLTLGSTASRPVVYLTAFVFGYSIEAFVATLNRLNTAVAKSMSPAQAK